MAQLTFDRAMPRLRDPRVSDRDVARRTRRLHPCRLCREADRQHARRITASRASRRAWQTCRGSIIMIAAPQQNWGRPRAKSVARRIHLACMLYPSVDNPTDNGRWGGGLFRSKPAGPNGDSEEGTEAARPEHEGSADECHAEPSAIRFVRGLVARRAVGRATPCSADYPRK
jgi:hypothetical protein